MIITNVIPLDNKRGKVYIDGKYAFPLYLREISRFNIVVDRVVSEAEYDEIYNIVVRRIRERALYLLEAMPRTESNIRRKLMDNYYTEEYISPIIEELKGYGYIDDRSYAYNYAISMSENRGMSRKAIINKLFEKGIDRDLIEEAISILPKDETELINKVLKKKGINFSDINNMEYKERQKVYRYLNSKGFSISCINMY